MPEQYEYEFICPLANGFHARPASRFEKLVCGFTCNVSLQNLSNGKIANARSILSLVSADIKLGDKCLLKISGDDSDAAYRELTRFVREELPTCDQALPQTDQDRPEAEIPYALRQADVAIVPGRPLVAGFGRGKAVFVKSLVYPSQLDDVTVTDLDAEQQKLEAAVIRLQNDLTAKIAQEEITSVEKEIMQAHLSIVSDVEFVGKIDALIHEQGVCAGKAISEAFSFFSDILNKAESLLIRERVTDLRDVCSRLIAAIYGLTSHDRIELTEPSVCVAEDLTPSQFIHMDKTLLAGLVLTHVGSTSHTVILARSFGIPTLTGIDNVDQHVQPDRDVIVDADHGFLLTDINRQAQRFYHRRRRYLDLRQQQIAAVKDKPAVTQDGRQLEVMANVATAGEVEAAIKNGAEGIGLFRTEMLFMDRAQAPDEQEQFLEYKAAAEYAADRPVIIRTFDIGGDKMVDYLQVGTEENPVLGCRGVRLYQQYEHLLASQLRAVLRASAFGCLKIMIPMVTCLEEVLYVRGVLDKVKAELDEKSVSYDRNIAVGIMIEVPSVTFLIPQLAEVVDFLSIGTNDLTQYFLAVDRCNARISSLYQARHPGLLGLIHKIVDDAHRCGLWVGMCGEMAGQIECLPLLLATGIDEVSVSIPAVSDIKAACGYYDSDQCRRLLDEAKQTHTAAEVDVVLQEGDPYGRDAAVIDSCLIDLDADCINKQEAIQYISEMLALGHRTRRCRKLEDDFWKRESTYSTGLGHGFAVPHCKTSYIQANSICVLRLREPIEWESIDEKPVRVVIGMTIRDVQDAGVMHMRIFSKLARNIMHEEFRRQLESLQGPDDVVAYLYQKLELDT